MRNLLWAFCLLGTLNLSAQSFEVGLMGGVAVYNGEFIPRDFNGYLQMTHPAAGAFARLNVVEAFAFRLGFIQTQVSGSDEISIYPHRNLSFRSNISELHLVGEWRPFRWQGRGSNIAVSPYLFGGIQAYRFNPQTKVEGNWVDLQPLGTEGQGLPGYEEKYELIQYAVPVGLGFRFDIDEKWAFGVEFGGRKLFTDYLDDVGGTLVVYDDILKGNGTLAAQLSNPNIDVDGSDAMISYRRGGYAEDWYYVGNVSLAYKFGGGNGVRRKGKSGTMKCPQF